MQDWIVALVVLTTLKWLLVGEWWPWQRTHRCPYCHRPWTAETKPELVERWEDGQRRREHKEIENAMRGGD